MKKFIFIPLFISILFTQSAIADDSQQVIAARILQALSQGRMSSGFMANESNVTLPVFASLTNEQINQLINSSHQSNIPDLKIVKYGFSIDGQQYIDPEGEIVQVAISPTDGNVVYAIKLGGVLVLKYLKTGSSMQPIAFTRYNSGTGQIELLNGEKLQGEQIALTSKGLLISRGNTVFFYSLGERLISKVIPDGWTVAQFQRGAVDNTRLILLESNKPSNIMSSMASLGSTLGVSKKEDYALLNIDDLTIFPVNMDKEGKSQNQMSNCVRKNQYVNTCSSVQTFESLYKVDGRRNLTHYYWGLNWFYTPQGTILLSLENGVTTVVATKLPSGESKTLFKNVLGMHSVDYEQNKDGKISATAMWALKKYSSDDVTSEFESKN